MVRTTTATMTAATITMPVVRASVDPRMMSKAAILNAATVLRPILVIQPCTRTSSRSTRKAQMVRCALHLQVVEAVAGLGRT